VSKGSNITYVTDLLDITTNKDETETNLIVSFLTFEAISDFDTIPNSDGEIEEIKGQRSSPLRFLEPCHVAQVLRYM
jgi:hypothetical protein